MVSFQIAWMTWRIREYLFLDCRSGPGNLLSWPWQGGLDAGAADCKDILLMAGGTSIRQEQPDICADQSG